MTIEKAIAQIEYIKRMEQEHQQLEGIKDDLAIASQIQQSILPRIFPPFPDVADKLDISACMYAAKDVGGDFYDFFRIDNDRIGFVMADVSGKGIPAAIFMAVSRTILRTTAIQGMSPSECVTRSNSLISKESYESMFVTVFYGIYDIRTGEITYVNAGHNPPCILKKNGTVEELPQSMNLMVGILDGFESVHVYRWCDRSHECRFPDVQRRASASQPLWYGSRFLSTDHRHNQGRHSHPYERCRTERRHHDAGTETTTVTTKLNLLQ